MGEAKREPLRVDFDRRPKLEIHGGQTSYDAGLLLNREPDDALALNRKRGRYVRDHAAFALRGVNE